MAGSRPDHGRIMAGSCENRLSGGGLRSRPLPRETPLPASSGQGPLPPALAAARISLPETLREGFPAGAGRQKSPEGDLPPAVRSLSGLSNGPDASKRPRPVLDGFSGRSSVTKDTRPDDIRPCNLRYGERPFYRIKFPRIQEPGDGSGPERTEADLRGPGRIQGDCLPAGGLARTFVTPAGPGTGRLSNG
jgi:hypothetical protein